MQIKYKYMSNEYICYVSTIKKNISLPTNMLVILTKYLELYKNHGIKLYNFLFEYIYTF